MAEFDFSKVDPNDLLEENQKGEAGPKFDFAALSDDQKADLIKSTAPEQSYGAGLARQAAQGLTLGFGDEIEAGARSMFGDRGYEDVLSEIRGQNKRFESENPIAANVAQLAGGFATGGVGGARVLGAKAIMNAPKLYKYATALGSGAAAGAAGGFGSGEGGLENRLEGAKEGAIWGGALGTLAPTAGAMLSKGRGALRNIRGYKDAAAMEKADDIIANTLRKDNGPELDDIGEYLGGYADHPVSLLDAGPPQLQRLGSAVQASGGDAGDVISDFVGRRNASMRGDLNKSISQNVSDRPVASELIDDINLARKARQDELYPQAIQAKVGSKELDILSEDPFIQNAMKKAAEMESRAARISRAKGEDVSSSQFLMGEDGIVRFSPEATTNSFNFVKKSMDDTLEPYYKGTVEGAGRNTAESLNNLRRSFLDEIDRLNPEYKTARAASAEGFEAKRAVELGQSLGKKAMQGNETDFMALVNNFDDLPTPQKTLVRSGVADSLRQELAKPNGVNYLSSRLVQGDAAPSMLKRVLGEKEFENLMSDIAIKKRISQTNNNLVSGSRTTPLAKDTERLNEAANDIVGAGMDLATGNTAGLGTKAIKYGTNLFNNKIRGRNDAVNKYLAKTLTSTNQDEILEILNRLAQRQQGKLAKEGQRQIRTGRGAGALSVMAGIGNE